MINKLIQSIKLPYQSHTATLTIWWMLCDLNSSKYIKRHQALLTNYFDAIERSFTIEYHFAGCHIRYNMFSLYFYQCITLYKVLCYLLLISSFWRFSIAFSDLIIFLDDWHYMLMNIRGQMRRREEANMIMKERSKKGK
jgi:hypothetical protein